MLAILQFAPVARKRLGRPYPTDNLEVLRGPSARCTIHTSTTELLRKNGA